MTVLPAGVDWVALENAVHAWVTTASRLLPEQVYFGRQTHSPRVGEPAIEMVFHVSEDDGLPWLDHATNYVTLPSVNVTAIDVLTNTLTVPGHAFETGDGPLQYTTSALLPTPLVPQQRLWAVKVGTTGTQVQLATSFQNALDDIVVDLTSEGAGTMFLSSTDRTLRADQEEIYIARSQSRVTLTLTSWTTNGVGINSALAVLKRFATRSILPAVVEQLAEANIGFTEMSTIRTIKGVKNAVQFEPRATVDVYLAVPVEEAEFGPIIERVEVTDETNGNTRIVAV